VAIDTRTKRASAQAYPFQIPTYPFPSGSVGDSDRAHAAGFYSGHTYAAPAAFTSYGPLFLYTASNWTGMSPYFESTMKIVSSSAKARLYDETDTAAVADSTVESVSSSYERKRSVALTLTDGNEYRAQLMNGDGSYLGAKLFFIATP